MLIDDAKLILEDMRDGNPHAAWDWESDARFAKAVGDTEAIQFFAELLRSKAPWPHTITAHKIMGKKIKARRLRALRYLARHGYIDTWWRGTGPGGMNDFGVRRNRCYVLREE